MTNKQWDSRNDNINNEIENTNTYFTDDEFEQLLQDTLSDLPPDKIAEDVTPWYRAMNHVLLGIAYTLLTIRVLWLDYILPALGHLFCVLGFRALRKENIWFRMGWILSIYGFLYYYGVLLLNTTVYRAVAESSLIWDILTKANLLSQFLMAVCLWRGCRAVQKKAGVPKKDGGTIALIVWTVIMYFLGKQNIQLHGWLFVILLAAIYIGIIKSLFKIVNDLDEAGYAIQPAAVRISDKTLTKGIIGLLLIGAACGYTFFNRYPMEWENIGDIETVEKLQEYEMNTVESAEANMAAKQLEIRKNLIELGFPEDILYDLTEEDLLACEGAKRVDVHEDYESLSEPREVRVETTTSYYIKQEYSNEFRMTSICILLSEDEELWKVIHHFEFVKDVAFYGTESIRHYAQMEHQWELASEYTGQVLYNDKGDVYTAPYYFVKEDTVSTSGLWGTSRRPYIFAVFSFPDKGENQRGYISYETKRLTEHATRLYTDMFYKHQTSWWQYPVKTSYDFWKTSSWNKVVKSMSTYTYVR